MRQFRAKPRTIKFALRLLVLATIFPTWLATIFYIIHSNEAQRVLLEQNTVGTARALMQAVDRELTGTRSALEVLATSPSLVSSDLSGLYNQAQEVLRRGAGTNIVLYGPTGNQLLNTLMPFGSPLPEREGPPSVLQAFGTKSPVISDLYKGRVSQRLLIGVLVPVLVDGRVPYALGMALYPEHLGEILSAQSLPQNWIASIFDSTGTIVARTHHVSEFVGKKGSSTLVRRMSEASDGVLESETLEGIQVLSGFSRSAVSGWAVAIGAPKSETLDALQRSLWMSIAGATALLAGCLWLAQGVSVRITKSIQALETNAVILGEGEVIPEERLSIEEADDARGALVKASHILRQRAAERDEAERTERTMVVAKRAAEEANRAKSEFLAGMSHEIRTPITAILGMADLLEGSQLTAKQGRHVAVLKEASQSLLAIVDDLLDVSKIEAGKLELDRDAIRVSAIAEAASAIVEQSARAKGLELGRELASDLPTWIEGDATRLRQVLLNLLSNAIKFTERGSVVLRVMRVTEPARLRFEVEDTGIGIDPAQRHLLFQRFSQIGDSIRRHFGGTGLGLAISRNLVEMMGGTIGVESRVGSGSTFWFTIPYVETKAPAAAEGRKATADAVPRARVLVAEDNAMIRELIEAMLRDAGHEVVLVRNGIEAIEAVEASDFDVVLMDVQMPELDGISATRWIRAMSDRVRDVPIIALTAYAMPEDVQRCRAAGANEYLAKPIDRDQLLSLVGKWSRRGGAHSMASQAVPAATEVVDIAVLDHLEKRFGAHRAAHFSDQFREQLHKALSTITATTDRQRIAEESHNLISTAGAVGCNELVARSRTLMDAARRESTDLKPLVAELTMAAARALNAIQARCSTTNRMCRPSGRRA
jgi:signal transduction histidine kinase/DNA-binding response OmpR family regulator